MFKVNLVDEKGLSKFAVHFQSVYRYYDTNLDNTDQINDNERNSIDFTINIYC